MIDSVLPPDVLVHESVRGPLCCVPFARVLGTRRVESQIGNALRTGKSLDHLVDCYWLGQSGHRGQKENAAESQEHATDTPTRLGLLVEILRTVKLIC